MPVKNGFSVRCITGLMVVLFFSIAQLSLASQRYESVSQLKAASFLPEKILKSKLFKIADHVENNGFVNTYTVEYRSTSFKVRSNIALFKLIREIDAIEAMKKVEESDVFVNALKESGVATVEGLKHLFTNPSKTLGGAVDGISSLFFRAKESVVNSSPGETEDSRLEQTVGFSNAKREVAFRYKVDVYSRNPLLQEHLDRIAWAEYAGGLTLSVATMPLGGVAGLTLSVSGTARLLGEVIATTPPAELKLQNREKLEKMGINTNLVSLFIDNPHFSPLQQTAYVMALESIGTAKAKSLPLQVALQVNDRNMARSMTAVMVMLAGYSKKITPIKEFHVAARFFCGLDADGKLIVILPSDYITFNERLYKGIHSVENKNITGYELWSTGTVSARAQEFLKSSGWHLEQEAARKIGFVMDKKRY